MNSLRRKLLLSIITIISIFGVAIFGSDSAFARPITNPGEMGVPRIIREELVRKCEGWHFFSGNEPYFRGTNHVLTTNWISSDESGSTVVSSFDHSQEYKVEITGKLYFNTAIINCSGTTRSYRLANVKIHSSQTHFPSNMINLDTSGAKYLKNEGAVLPLGPGVNVNTNSIGGSSNCSGIGYCGASSPSIEHLWGRQKVDYIRVHYKSYNFNRGDYRIERRSVDVISFNFDEVKKDLKGGVVNNVNILTVNCIKSSGEYTAAEERSILESGDYRCLDVQTKLQLSYLSYQTQGRSYVKNSKEADWGAASRSITVAAGETIQFRHELKNIGDASNDGMGDIVIRANGEYQTLWGNPDNKISNWTPGTVTRRNVANGQTFALATPDTRQVIQLNAHQLSYQTKPSDAGKTFCTRIEWTGGVRNMSPIQQPPLQYMQASAFTGWACAYVAYDYSPPTPSVVGGSGSACGGNCGEVEAGTPQVPLTSSVVKTSSSTQTKPIEWKLTHFVVKPNQAIPGVGGVGTTPTAADGSKLSGGFVSNYDVDPCATSIYNTAAVYNTGDASKRIQGCQTIANGTITNLDSTKTINIKLSGSSDPDNTFSVPETAEVGTKYCFALSISPYMMSKDWNKEQQDSFKDWHHGKPGCIIVVKKPKTQFLGGGIYAGGGVVASQSTRVTAYTQNTGPQSTLTSNVERKFGSWVEYELVVNKETNSGLATNGIFGSTMVDTANPNQAVTGIAGRTTKDVKFQNRLTLANNASTYGNFDGTNYAQAFFNRMKSFYQSRLSRMVTYTTGSGVSVGSEYNSNMDVNLGTISNTGGKTTVIYAPNNTVTISGNIQNTNINVRSVGQTIIIAKNININQNVTRVDAWLLASDSIDTCKITGSLSSTVCNNHLLVNGPVVVASNKADGLKLNRTAGSEGAGDGIGNPGETFLLGYDAYQWIVNQADVGGVRITTSYTKELPVRY